MDKRLLLFLEAIENSNSISEAAQKLYLSQPYVSRVIKKYEDLYNVTLIDRNTHPITLTPAGFSMIDYLHQDLQLQENLAEKMKQFTKNNFSFLRMGITPPLGESFNLTVLPQLLKQFPNLQTKTTELSTADAEKAFKDRQLDLFVGNTIYLANIASESLHNDQQILLLTKNSRLYQADHLQIDFDPQTIGQINHENFIIVGGERRYQTIVNNFFADIGIHFYPRICVRDTHTALKLALKGLGNMTTTKQAVKVLPKTGINYMLLPLNAIAINFSISTIKQKKRMNQEIQCVKQILRKQFVSDIL